MNNFKQICAFLFFFIIGFGLSAQERLDVDSVSNYKFINPSILNANEVWGHVDSLGNEYALVGRGNGFSVISLADPANPQLVYSDTSALSLWRDVKSYAGYAYVVNEDRGGLEIFDLNGLPGPVTKVGSYLGDTIPLQKAHNLYIDSNGVAYLFGTNSNLPNSSGTIFLDLATDPENPIELGNYDSLYLHDGYVRNNILYGGAVYAGKMVILDVSDKSKPVFLGARTTPSSFTHNVWLSDDGQTAFTTDEVSGGYIAAYDVSNPQLIPELDRIRSRNTTDVIPHNTHVLNDFLVTSYYTSGVSIIDASNPDNLVETGYFDTSPNSGGGFSGNWGAYPFLPSGLLLVTDMQEGLFVLRPHYTRAAFLDVFVSDCEGNQIDSARLLLKGSLSAVTNLAGNAEFGDTLNGIYQLQIEADGYYADSLMVELRPGDNKRISVVLRDTNSAFTNAIFDDQQNPVSNGKVSMINADTALYGNADSNGRIRFEGLDFGDFEIRVGAWGYENLCINEVTFNCQNDSDSYLLSKKIEDNFELDLGWTVTGRDSLGAWTRATPIGTVDQVRVANPGIDALEDCGSMAYVTGNGDGPADAFDVDSSTFLRSPQLDLSDFLEPHLVFNRWFYNSGVLDDQLVISFIDTAGNKIYVKAIFQNDPNSVWVLEDIKVSDYISPLALKHIEFEVIDKGVPSIVEAGIDNFFVSEGQYIGLSENEKNSQISLYPNPFENEIIISAGEGEFERVELYDAAARIVKQMPMSSSEMRLSLGDANPKGFYLIRLIREDGSFVQKKLIKQ